MTDTYTCALWYMRNLRPEYELCTTEGEAARYAVHLVDNENGSPLGIQYADGRTIPEKEWPLIDEMRERMDQEERDRRAEYANRVPPPARQAVDPFRGAPVEIDLDEPGWLGQ